MSLRILFSFLLILFIQFASAQECGVIYVASNGASSGAAGTRANPANLSYGLQLVTAQNNRIWMQQGVYNLSQPLQLINNVIIDGGFDASWIKSNVTPTVLRKDASNIIPLPANALVAIAGINVSNFSLHDLTIEMADAPGVAVTTYGIYLSGCSNYNIVRCNVTSGAGSSGVAGAPGVPGVAGAAGGNGIAGGLEPVKPGAAGGAGAGGNNGGNGANSGRHGTVGASGSAGIGACGGSGGGTGTGPSCSLGCTFGSPNCNSASPGQAGTLGCGGTSGAAGANGPAGTIVGGYFVPGVAGANGISGTNGSGGGGGGGGGGRQNSGSDDVGGSGGGGGGGGGGGTGGTGGTGGGGSFAVFLFNNGAAGNIVDCNLIAGAAGAGGIGGAGAAGAAGGNGGTGGTPGCGNTPGGAGGAGGAGGSGGAGGNGASGLSLALSENGGTAVAQQNITSVPGNPPAISVDNRGCTDADVVFTSSVSGNWNFGTGASPSSLSGSGPHLVTYSNIGRKDIQFNGVIYTGFIEIFQNAGVANSITPANGTTTNGCPETFSTTAVGSLYEWDFGASAIPPVASGATLNSTDVIFLAPGVYTVRLWVTTACCGRVKDSTIITVNPNSINVTLGMSPSGGACLGEPLTFNASPSTYQAYNFLVNGVSVQNTVSATYISDSLNNGDTISVLAFDGICFSNPSANIIATVFPIPSVTLTSLDPDNEICEGESITFTAAPSGLDNYEFFNNGVSVQVGASDTYTTSTLTTPNSINIIATDNGCPSVLSNSIVTNVIPAPLVTITSSDNDNQICEADSVTFTALPSGFDNYEFFENGISVQSGVGNTYATTLLQNNTAVTVVATENGCPGPSSNIIETAVYTYPTITLIDDDADDLICEGTSVTFTALPVGLTNYEFFNNGFSIISSSSETYTTTTLQPNNSITVVGTNVICPSIPSAAIVIEVVPAPFVNAGADLDICLENIQVGLTGFLPLGGTWSGVGITDTAVGIFNPIISGSGIHPLFYTYTDSVTQCSSSDTLLFTVFALQDASFNASPLVLETDSSEPVIFSYTGSAAVQYLWDFGDGNTSTEANPQHFFSDTGFYTISLIVVNELGCSDTVVSTRYIEVISKPTLYIPNAFSPNGDGENDVFFIYGSGIKEFTLRVFDRWGTFIYESQNIEQGWNGTFKGKVMDQGVYVYYLKMVLKNLTIENRKGSIMLLR